MSALVVPAQKEQAVRIPDFERPQVKHALSASGVRLECQSRNEGSQTHLDAEVPPVDIISQEQISCIRRTSAHFEQLHQVILSTSGHIHVSLSLAPKNVYNKTNILTVHISAHYRFQRRSHEQLSKIGGKAWSIRAPVMGASTSNTFGSVLKTSVAFSMMNKACSSVTRPSR
jgi:hypothetical protein